MSPGQGFLKKRAIRKALTALNENGYFPKGELKEKDYEALSTGAQTYWTTGLEPCEAAKTKVQEDEEEGKVAPTSKNEITGIVSTSLAITGGVILKPLAEALGYETVKSTGNVPPPEGVEIHPGEGGEVYCYGRCEWEGADGYHHSYQPDTWFSGHDVASINHGPDYGHAAACLSPLWILSALGFSYTGYRLWAANQMTPENIRTFLDENDT
jgi:hypothetical protein